MLADLMSAVRPKEFVEDTAEINLDGFDLARAIGTWSGQVSQTA